MKNDMFGMVNRVKFEYSHLLKRSVVVPSIDCDPSGYADASSQLLLRACHDRDDNKNRIEVLYQDLDYLRKEANSHNEKLEGQERS